MLLLPMSKVPRLIFRTVLVVIGLILVINCAILIAVGKINFSTVIPLLLGVVFITHGLYWRRICDYITKKRWLKLSWYSLWGLFFIWLLSFVIFIQYLQQQIELSKKPLEPVVAIIVLGSGTVAGKPTPTLAARLDTAVSLINAEPQALVITSGGIGFGRTHSEANIMATYLNTRHSVPFDKIWQEGKSTSTEENLANTKAIIQDQGVSLAEPIAVVTSDFHIIRAAAIARRQGYVQPVMLASPTPLSIRYNAWFREYFAFISGWILGEY